jgi:hypothetical protein
VKSSLNSHCSKDNVKKMIAKNIGGKSYMKTNQKNCNDSINQKLSRNKSNLGRMSKKSRNSSKNSLSRHGDPETKTYTSVLQKKENKDHLSKNTMFGSPEENKFKFLSDKTNKSSLTSSTTTHTNNRKKRG